MTKYKKTKSILQIGNEKKNIDIEYVEVGAGELNDLLSATDETNEIEMVDKLIKKSGW